MSEPIDPPDPGHLPGCEDSEEDYCICEDLLEDEWERRQEPAFDTWKEWALDQADRYDMIDYEEG